MMTQVQVTAEMIEVWAAELLDILRQAHKDDLELRPATRIAAFGEPGAHALQHLKEMALRLSKLEGAGDDEEVEKLRLRWQAMSLIDQKLQVFDELASVTKHRGRQNAEILEMTTWMIEAMTLEQLDALIQRAEASKSVTAMAQFCSESIARKDAEKLRKTVEQFCKAASMVQADIGSKKLNGADRISISVSSLAMLMEALGTDSPSETS